MNTNIIDVQSITFNTYDIIRVWFNGKIVWQKPNHVLYLSISENSIELNKSNDFINTFEVLSNTDWTFQT